jgi:PucR family transcriptional regulator, purine catabolism regulatory protein
VLSVRELIRDLDVRLLGGEGNLDVPVRWVHISELTDPTPWLSGGEVLLTTGLQLTDAAEQAAFVGRLVDAQLAGLGVGTGFAHAVVPEPLLAAAREREFPVFEVPYEVPFIAITEKAFTRLVNEQYEVLRRSIVAHERLERIVLSERGLDGVAGALATLIGGMALVLDARGEPLAERAFRRELPADALAAISGEVRRRSAPFAPEAEDLAGRALALPVTEPARSGNGAGGPARAWLVAVKDAGGLSEFDRLTLHHAVTIVALELLRRRVAADTERRLAGDVLSGAVSGELAGADLARRLEPFGVGDRVAALVLGRATSAPVANGRRAEGASLEPALSAALAAEGPGGLVASHGSFACALVPELPEDELLALAERLRAAVASAAAAPVLGGAGRAVPAGEARRAFHEARCAFEALALTGPVAEGGSAPERVASYRDLGSFQLLLSLQDDDALRLFCDSVLGPIEAGEGHYGDELLRSLEAFIECNGQWEAAARRLYCHRHTLRYRIRKVEELTGRSLSSARDRIEFWLALRGRDLVEPVA